MPQYTEMAVATALIVLADILEHPTVDCEKNPPHVEKLFAVLQEQAALNPSLLAITPEQVLHHLCESFGVAIE